LQSSVICDGRIHHVQFSSSLSPTRRKAVVHPNESAANLSFLEQLSCRGKRSWEAMSSTIGGFPSTPY
jgi:hypothetical protein